MSEHLFHLTIATLVSVVPALHAGAGATDSAFVAADSIYGSLHEVTVTTVGPRRLLRESPDGTLGIDGRMLGEQVTFLGSGDPLAVTRSLPAVSTSNDLQAAYAVRGGSTGDNLLESDGARIVNPLHMLGLFSAFNPSYYRSYGFSAARVAAEVPSLTGARFTAESGLVPDSVAAGSVTAGIIESHGALRLPLWRGASAAIGLRQTYLDFLFPDLLTLGSSRLGYGFTDINAAIVSVAGADTLRLSGFGNHDRMSVRNRKNGSKDGALGRGNLAVSAAWHRPGMRVSLAYSGYSGSFSLEEGGRRIDLPSRLRQFTAGVSCRAGAFTLGGDAGYRYVSGQNGFGRACSGEANLAADYRLALPSAGIRLDAGLRVALYGCGAYRVVRPLPSLAVDYTIGDRYVIYAGARRRMRFDRLVEETTAGLPADFWICAGEGLPAEDVYSAEIGARGNVPGTGILVSIEGYGRLSRHTAEFGGSLLDLASADYNPLTALYFGRGRAAGISLTALRQTGRIRGQISYNYGISRTRIAHFGTASFPSAHDRPHDLNVRLNWTIMRGVDISATFTYATGLPCTLPKYGYMIGENLICEYYPHNSSRLPAYRRLDVAATYAWGGLARHKINLSVYNAAASRNLLFSYHTYSPELGIYRRESVMKAVIPSVAYTFEF